MNVLGFDDTPEEVQEEEKEEKISLFDIIYDISLHGELVDNYLESYGDLPKAYSKFMINRALGNTEDTIMMGSILNMYPNIPDSAHYLFLRRHIPKRKRFSKWYKPEEDKTIPLLSKYFGCSEREMKKNLRALTKEEKDEIIDLLTTPDPESSRNKGKGIRNRKRN